MSTANSTTIGAPLKPFLDFPLFAHASGRWAKKIKGKFRYFGPWRDPQGALARYYKEKDDWEAGRVPQRGGDNADSLTVHQMVSLFLESKKLKVQSGEMEARTWEEYKSYGERMEQVFGKHTAVENLGPNDFKRLRADFQKTHKTLVSIRGDIRKTKVYFNWAGPGANGQGFLNRMPRFGDAFKPPSQSALEREREAQGERVFTAEQIRSMLISANVKLLAMVLLGVNCGYGNTDCAKLLVSKLDLVNGWANFARTKNGIRRRNPLWPETVEAIRRVLASRPKPRESQWAGLVFLTHREQPFSAPNLAHEFDKLAKKAGVPDDAADFYNLRRTCASIGVQMKDDDAVRTIMGHKRPATDMLGVYNRLSVSDERLQTVSEHIRDWLFTGWAIPLPQQEIGGADSLAAPSSQARRRNAGSKKRRGRCG